MGKIVANAFGGDIRQPEDLIYRIQNDPQSQIKLAEIESNKLIELNRLAVLEVENQLKYRVENTKDARAKNAETGTFFPQIISSIVVMGFFACIYWVAAYKQDSTDHDVLYMLLGITGTSFGAVINYWLGSSMDRKK